MLAILSPAKSLNTEAPADLPATTTPQFLADASAIAEHMRGYAPSDLARLMKLSDPLSALNAARFEEWNTNHEDPALLPAVFAFNGDVYQGLDVRSLPPETWALANDKIRILSGLYGLLKPFDALRAYRLEMGTKLSDDRYRSLPAFWQDKVTRALNEALNGRPLVNLASAEYAAAVNFKGIKSPVITPVFKDLKGGEYKIISFYAKRARGMMARHLIEQDVQTLDQLTQFHAGGYAFSANDSTDAAPCFMRDPERA